MATEFFDRDGDGTNPSELIDMGRFMQREWRSQVTYEGSTYTGSIQLSAMTRHFVLSQKVTAPGTAAEVTLKIQMQGEALSRYTEAEWLDGSRALSITDAMGEGWSFIVPEREGAALQPSPS